MNTKSISCEYCDDTGYIEISGPGGCYDKECACVPFRQHIAELEGDNKVLRDKLEGVDGNWAEAETRAQASENALAKVLEQLEDWCGRDLGTEPHISDIIKEARDE